MADTLNLSVIARIQKLLALAECSGATEAEATNAAEKAQYLMAEYNIEMASVTAHNGAADPGSARLKHSNVDRTVYKWRRDLMREVGKLNFCVVELEFARAKWNRPQSFEGFTIYGRQANVASTRVMFDYLTQTIERLAREWAKDQGCNIFAKSAILFREGCAKRLQSRIYHKHLTILREQREKAEADRAANANFTGSTLPAVILADYADAEEDFNNDLRRGDAPGTAAARRQARKSQQLRIKEVEIQYDVEWGVAWDHVVHGMSIEDAKAALAALRAQTASQAQKDPEKAARRERRYQEQYDRDEARRHARQSSEGYQAGREAGNQISLDRQLNETRKLA